MSMAEYSDTEATQAEEWRQAKLRRVNYADFEGMSDNGKGLQS